MAIVKYFPTKDQTRLVSAVKKSERDYLTAKVVKENENGTVDLVVSVPGEANEFVKGTSDFEAIESHKTLPVAQPKNATVKKAKVKKSTVASGEDFLKLSPEEKVAFVEGIAKEDVAKSIKSGKGKGKGKSAEKEKADKTETDTVNAE